MTGLIGKMTGNNWIFEKCEILKRVQKFCRLVSVIDFWMAMTGIIGKMTEKSMGELKLKASYYYYSTGIVILYQKVERLWIPQLLSLIYSSFSIIKQQLWLCLHVFSCYR